MTLLGRAPARAAGLATVAALVLGACSGGGARPDAAANGAADGGGPAPAGGTGPATDDATGAPGATPSPSEAPSEAPGPTPLGTVSPSVRRTLPPARPSVPVTVAPSARAVLVGSREVTVEARGPGEIGGPAIAVTLAVTNPSARRLSLRAVAVTAEIDGQEAEVATAPPAAPLGGVLAPGATVRAVYVFVVPRQVRGSLELTVSLAPEVPVARFTVPV